MEENKVYIGLVIWFSNAKGYGFIQWSDENNIPQADLFLHYSDIDMAGYKTVNKEQRVQFQIGKNLRNQPKAICVKIIQ